MIKTFDYEKLPVVEVVNEILYDSVKRGASDIHFDPEEEEMLVRIRVDGELMNYTSIPNSIKKNLITRIKIISGMNITESRLPQDGAIKTTLQNIDLDLRVSCLPTINGEKIVLKPFILPHLSKLTQDDLDKVGGKDRLRSDQGFYVYRNKRLIIWGTWFRLERKDELNKLANNELLKVNKE